MAVRNKISFGIGAQPAGMKFDWPVLFLIIGSNKSNDPLGIALAAARGLAQAFRRCPNDR
jgi:hypothetical protein